LIFIIDPSPEKRVSRDVLKIYGGSIVSKLQWLGCDVVPGSGPDRLRFNSRRVGEYQTANKLQSIHDGAQEQGSGGSKRAAILYTEWRYHRLFLGAPVRHTNKSPMTSI
jgi:hypothetical protein